MRFKVASFRETDREQKSIPMFLTSEGAVAGKEKAGRVWDYELTADDGKVYISYGQRKRGGWRKGQVVMTELQGRDSQWIGRVMTVLEFNHRAARVIDIRKARMKEDEAEIARVRAL